MIENSEKITISYRWKPDPFETDSLLRGSGISKLDLIKENLKRTILEEIEKRGLLEIHTREINNFQHEKEIYMTLEIVKPKNHGDPLWEKV